MSKRVNPLALIKEKFNTFIDTDYERRWKQHVYSYNTNLCKEELAINDDVYARMNSCQEWEEGKIHKINQRGEYKNYNIKYKHTNKFGQVIETNVERHLIIKKIENKDTSFKYAKINESENTESAQTIIEEDSSEECKEFNIKLKETPSEDNKEWKKWREDISNRIFEKVEKKTGVKHVKHEIFKILTEIGEDGEYIIKDHLIYYLVFLLNTNNHYILTTNIIALSCRKCFPEGNDFNKYTKIQQYLLSCNNYKNYLIDMNTFPLRKALAEQFHIYINEIFIFLKHDKDDKHELKVQELLQQFYDSDEKELTSDKCEDINENSHNPSLANLNNVNFVCQASQKLEINNINGKNKYCCVAYVNDIINKNYDDYYNSGKNKLKGTLTKDEENIVYNQLNNLATEVGDPTINAALDDFKTLLRIAEPPNNVLNDVTSESLQGGYKGGSKKTNDFDIVAWEQENNYKETYALIHKISNLGFTKKDIIKLLNAYNYKNKNIIIQNNYYYGSQKKMKGGTSFSVGDAATIKYMLNEEDEFNKQDEVKAKHQLTKLQNKNDNDDDDEEDIEDEIKQALKIENNKSDDLDSLYYNYKIETLSKFKKIIINNEDKPFSLTLSDKVIFEKQRNRRNHLLKTYNDLYSKNNYNYDTDTTIFGKYLNATVNIEDGQLQNVINSQNGIFYGIINNTNQTYGEYISNDGKLYVDGIWKNNKTDDSKLLIDGTIYICTNDSSIVQTMVNEVELPAPVPVEVVAAPVVEEVEEAAPVVEAPVEVPVEEVEEAAPVVEAPVEVPVEEVEAPAQVPVVAPAPVVTAPKELAAPAQESQESPEVAQSSKKRRFEQQGGTPTEPLHSPKPLKSILEFAYNYMTLQNLFIGDYDGYFNITQGLNYNNLNNFIDEFLFFDLTEHYEYKKALNIYNRIIKINENLKNYQEDKLELNDEIKYNLKSYINIFANQQELIQLQLALTNERSNDKKNIITREITKIKNIIEKSLKKSDQYFFFITADDRFSHNSSKLLYNYNSLADIKNDFNFLSNFLYIFNSLIDRNMTDDCNNLRTFINKYIQSEKIEEHKKELNTIIHHDTEEEAKIHKEYIEYIKNEHLNEILLRGNNFVSQINNRRTPDTDEISVRRKTKIKELKDNIQKNTYELNFIDQNIIIIFKSIKFKRLCFFKSLIEVYNNKFKIEGLPPFINILHMEESDRKINNNENIIINRFLLTRIHFLEYQTSQDYTLMNKPVKSENKFTTENYTEFDYKIINFLKQQTSKIRSIETELGIKKNLLKLKDILLYKEPVETTNNNIVELIKNEFNHNKPIEILNDTTLRDITDKLNTVADFIQKFNFVKTEQRLKEIVNTVKDIDNDYKAKLSFSSKLNQTFTENVKGAYNAIFDKIRNNTFPYTWNQLLEFVGLTKTEKTDAEHNIQMETEVTEKLKARLSKDFIDFHFYFNILLYNINNTLKLEGNKYQIKKSQGTFQETEDYKKNTLNIVQDFDKLIQLNEIKESEEEAKYIKKKEELLKKYNETLTDTKTYISEIDNQIETLQKTIGNKNPQDIQNETNEIRELMKRRYQKNKEKDIEETKIAKTNLLRYTSSFGNNVYNRTLKQLGHVIQKSFTNYIPITATTIERIYLSLLYSCQTWIKKNYAFSDKSLQDWWDGITNQKSILKYEEGRTVSEYIKDSMQSTSRSVASITGWAGMKTWNILVEILFILPRNPIVCNWISSIIKEWIKNICTEIQIRLKNITLVDNTKTLNDAFYELMEGIRNGTTNLYAFIPYDMIKDFSSKLSSDPFIGRFTGGISNAMGFITTSTVTIINSIEAFKTASMLSARLDITGTMKMIMESVFIAIGLSIKESLQNFNDFNLYSQEITTIISTFIELSSCFTSVKVNINENLKFTDWFGYTYDWNLPFYLMNPSQGKVEFASKEVEGYVEGRATTSNYYKIYGFQQKMESSEKGFNEIIINLTNGYIYFDEKLNTTYLKFSTNNNEEVLKTLTKFSLPSTLLSITSEMVLNNVEARRKMATFNAKILTDNDTQIEYTPIDIRNENNDNNEYTLIKYITVASPFPLNEFINIDKNGVWSPKPTMIILSKREQQKIKSYVTLFVNAVKSEKTSSNIKNNIYNNFEKKYIDFLSQLKINADKTEYYNELSILYSFSKDAITLSLYDMLCYLADEPAYISLKNMYAEKDSEGYKSREKEILWKNNVYDNTYKFPQQTAIQTSAGEQYAVNTLSDGVEKRLKLKFKEDLNNLTIFFTKKYKPQQDNVELKIYEWAKSINVLNLMNKLNQKSESEINAQKKRETQSIVQRTPYEYDEDETFITTEFERQLAKIFNYITKKYETNSQSYTIGEIEYTFSLDHIPFLIIEIILLYKHKECSENGIINNAIISVIRKTTLNQQNSYIIEYNREYKNTDIKEFITEVIYPILTKYFSFLIYKEKQIPLSDMQFAQNNIQTALLSSASSITTAITQATNIIDKNVINPLSKVGPSALYSYLFGDKVKKNVLNWSSQPSESKTGGSGNSGDNLSDIDIPATLKETIARLKNDLFLKSIFMNCKQRITEEYLKNINESREKTNKLTIKKNNLVDIEKSIQNAGNTEILQKKYQLQNEIEELEKRCQDIMNIKNKDNRYTQLEDDKDYPITIDYSDIDPSKDMCNAFYFSRNNVIDLITGFKYLLRNIDKINESFDNEVTAAKQRQAQVGSQSYNSYSEITDNPDLLKPNSGKSEYAAEPNQFEQQLNHAKPSISIPDKGTQPMNSSKAIINNTYKKTDIPLNAENITSASKSNSTNALLIGGNSKRGNSKHYTKKNNKKIENKTIRKYIVNKTI